MARMKFLCDADRCINCNACVTACKNENEVPWGVNRRRVVTINDGKPGERSISVACMHCSGCAVQVGVSGGLLLPDRRGRGAAQQGPVHRLRLLLLCLPLRGAAVSAGRQLRLARQDGQVHLLRRRSRKTTTPTSSSRSMAAIASPRASCPCARRCARPRPCWPATAIRSRPSTASASSPAASGPVPGVGARPIRAAVPDRATGRT